MELAHGLFDARITPSSFILLSCTTISSQAANGTHRAACLIGVTPLVFMLNSTRLVSALSSSAIENMR